MTGCNVRDDGRPCRMGLFIEEHRLGDVGWLHPDECDEDVENERLARQRARVEEKRTA